MYLMNFPTRTAPAARQLSGCSGFFAPRTPLTRQGTPPRWTPGREIPPFFTRGGGSKNPLDPLAPEVPAPVNSGEGDTSVFYAGWGLKKPTGPTGPRGARPGPSRSTTWPRRSQDCPATATPAQREYDRHAPPAGVLRRPPCAPEDAPP